MKQRIEFDASGTADLWAADQKLAVGPAVERLVREEFTRLSREATASRSQALLTDAQIDEMRAKAREIVLRRLRAEDVTVVGEEDRDLDVLLAETRREFATPDFDVDASSAIIHRKATVVLAASQKPVCETTYLAALHAVSSETARATDKSELDLHCRAAEALSDLAEHNLRTRGVRRSDPHYEDEYVAEITRVSAEHNLPYH